MIKAIETEYNGYKFRSRLEARWAVFFDAAHISYQYEPEGFDLNGDWYLPDFYLPDFMIYVEIKPFDRNVVKHTGDNNEWERLCRRFRDYTDNAILLCYGEPAEDVYKILFAFDTCDSGGGSSEYEALFVTYNYQTVLVTSPERTDRDVHISNDMESSRYVGTPHQFAGDYDLLWDRAMIPFYPDGDDITTRAKLKARQARFEHGEKPII